MPPLCRGNLFSLPAGPLSEERFETLLTGNGFRLERIVSTGQVTPGEAWYDQNDDEWVVLLSGSARLRFEQPEECFELRPGDWVFIPAHCRHRVEWTDHERPSIWLALHATSDQPSPDESTDG